MLKDRVYGIRETLFHDPYYQRHVVGAPRVPPSTATGSSARRQLRGVPDQASNGSRRCSTSAATWTTVRRTPDGLKFESRLCIFDSEMIPNSIIYPI